MSRHKQRKAAKRKKLLLGVCGLAVGALVIDQAVLAPSSAGGASIDGTPTDAPGLIGTAVNAVKSAEGSISKLRELPGKIEQARELSQLLGSLSAGGAAGDATLGATVGSGTEPELDAVIRVLGGAQAAALGTDQRATPANAAETSDAAATATATAETEDPPKLRLSSVRLPPHAAAVINGVVYAMGETINDITLAAVSPEGATVIVGDEQTMIHLDDR